jgi:hypothetical protein
LTLNAAFLPKHFARDYVFADPREVPIPIFFLLRTESSVGTDFLSRNLEGGELDSFTQQQVFALRQEIAALQRANEWHRRKKYHTASEVNTDELRRFRLLAIKEELLRLNTLSKRIQLSPPPC